MCHAQGLLYVVYNISKEIINLKYVRNSEILKLSNDIMYLKIKFILVFVYIHKLTNYILHSIFHQKCKTNVYD